MTLTTERPTIVMAGSNRNRFWGLTTGERARRLARERDFGWGEARGDAALVVNAAFVFDPLLLDYLAGQADTVLVADGRPVIANVAAGSAEAVVRAVEGDAMPERLARVAYDDDFTLYNHQLRKRERPFLFALGPDTLRQAERASYFGAYKGVTDVLTKYLWPEWALVLTRIAARAGATPNMVTALGALLCAVATVLFWQGHYWWGMAAGLGFMVLDTVDGKLARCTITSSKWGNVFDHGIDLVHPPFWWWAWAHGLVAWGLAYSNGTFAWVIGTILVGYVVQRLIEGVFMRRFGMHIHVWERFDSQFRLITARRNPNMVILFATTLAQRPDIGLIAVAWWTAISCAIHAVRLGQAEAARRRGQAIRSWLG